MSLQWAYLCMRFGKHFNRVTISFIIEVVKFVALLILAMQFLLKAVQKGTAEFFESHPS